MDELNMTFENISLEELMQVKGGATEDTCTVAGSGILCPPNVATIQCNVQGSGLVVRPPHPEPGPPDSE